MKRFFLALCLFCATCSLQAASRRHGANSVDKITKMIFDGNLPSLHQQSKKIANQIARDPGSHTPFSLCYAGIYFLKKKEFETAAPLCLGAIFRAQVDLRCCEDTDFPNLSSDFTTYIQSVFADTSLTKKEVKRLENAFEIANQNLEVWDRKTPRNYDKNWLGGSGKLIEGKEKEEIIQFFYRARKGEYSEEDCSQADPFDEYYFDRDTRIFYANEIGLKVTLPSTIEPLLDTHREYTSCFRLSSGSLMALDYGYTRKSFGELLKVWQEDAEETNRIGWSRMKVIPCNVGKNLSAFRVREHYPEDPMVRNTIHFIYNDCHFQFEMESTRANEKEDLKSIQPLLRSIKL